MTSYTINEALKSKLEEMFENRVSFSELERIVYSHDVGVIPDSVKKTIATMPDAVVQPVNSNEVSSLVRIAIENKIPLIPRGAASSGFGGAVPVANGIVIDFSRMNNIISIDPDDLSVEVEPGVVWSELDEKLKRKGLALRLYPSSAPTSTVAGWVAQGGSGIGSYEYGTFRDNIVSVEMVDPMGDLKVMKGDDIDLVYALGGITGIITKVTIKVKKAEGITPVLAAFTDEKKLQATLDEIRGSGTDLWSVSIQTPGYVGLSQQAANETKMPRGKYIAQLVYSQSHAEVASLIENIVSSNKGEILPEDVAVHEWDNRFRTMRLKRLGPSLVASELIVPTDSLGDFLKAVDRKFKGEFVFEGIMETPDRLIMMGFMLADERKTNYPLKFSSSLIVADIAKKMGGRLTATGIFFTDDSKELLGETLFNRVVAFKKEFDPAHIMNPGKILPPSVEKNSPIKQLSIAMKGASKGKSLMSFAGKIMDGKDVEYKYGDKLPEEIGKDAFICAQCGACKTTCTMYDADPWESRSPRGKWYLLSEYLKGNIEFDEEFASTMFLCATCKKCDLKCQTDLSIAHNFINMRSIMGQKNFENTGLGIIRENVLNAGNFWGLPGEALEWKADDMKMADTGAIGYWPGCWSSAVTKNMPQNIVRILNRAGVELVNLGEQDNICCGLYLALGGYTEDFVKTVEKNINLINEKGVKTLLFSCPGCFATFTEQYAAVAEMLGLDWDVETKHVVVLLDELIRDGKLDIEKPVDKKVTYHDACHVSRWFGAYEYPRNVINAIPGVNLVEMEHNREDALCCGIVTSFDDLPTVAHCGQKRIFEAMDTGADYVITNCAGCASQLNLTTNMMEAPVKQKDITDILCESMGIEVTYDPTETIGQFMKQAIELLGTSCVRHK
ncbi:FAD-binding and (Fe-S)-binding domain-containing protein [Methanolobus mangrovi]|uniref:FAD-binding and (Fe-S)-binding domain-containing protein n=1 Tax=Methanolobus mangrovi TaxID=3072977 RepID=A0AA51UG67_9EURY|nr:FAD-binding and (Fe-S)-binding domain-containing protein [Methanolobus mangrovi]WMW22603.1 FAD-binding and (Fe-S)-binding domain-containing protein [Methanolobus mangrovi]